MPVMTRFIIRYHSVTMASVAKRIEQQSLPLPSLKFEFPDRRTTQILGDAVKRVNDINLHTGLSLVVETYAQTREEAEASAKTLCEHLLNLISYSTLAFCGPARLISVIEFRTAERPVFTSYAYPFEENENLASIVPINQQGFREIFDAFNVSADQQRVARALSWLRKGINEENFVDEFTDYWIGLEVMKSVLRRTLKMRTKNPGKWDGIKQIYEQELQFTDFEKIGEARNQLLHGFKELSSDFINVIQTYVQPTRKTIITSIARVLGLQDATRESLQNRRVRRVRRNPWFVMEGELEHLPEKLEELAANFPSLSVHVKTNYGIGKTEALEVQIQTTNNFSGPSGVIWHPHKAEQWGDEDSGALGAIAGPINKN